MIDAGGDIYALGTNYGKPWVIGIRNPRGEEVAGTLELSDMAVITSGDYEREQIYSSGMKVEKQVVD